MGGLIRGWLSRGKNLGISTEWEYFNKEAGNIISNKNKRNGSICGSGRGSKGTSNTW